MPIKIIFIVVFIFILFCLGTALFNLVRYKDKEHSKKTVKALTYRIAISLALFIMMTIALMTGIIKPEGIGARMLMHKQNQLQSDTQVKP